ncbi:CoA ester lyase [Sphingomonas koreensis]|uniref:CoA ester lyase n=1 Tax=Sphingomonas koreensis TaxID=93064 RepID=A0A430G1W4_9SPHN|nr:CoA ester lyase [Sphingomonas koreensis]RSY82044.1 CoA ester lyase [Sphingomonas koreensis]
MTPRSWLFIPGDSDKKLGKADGAGADALILDLEDAVAPSAKDDARTKVADFLRARAPGSRRSQLWVRINPLSSGMALDDLVAVMPGAPDGLMLPKPDGPGDVGTLSLYLDALEAQHGIAQGATRILPVATETARAPFELGNYASAGLTRLAGLTWGAEDLSTALGASTNLDASGAWAFTYRMVRSLTLMAAHAAGVPAIETLYVDYRDDEGLAASCRAARAEGFSGRIAIHPAQVDPINRGFAPSPEEIEFARKVIAAFDAAPGTGTVGVDGRMLDIPHLKQAQHLLNQASRPDRGAA